MSSLTQVVTLPLERKPLSKSILIPINISKENLNKFTEDEAVMVTSQIFDPQDASPPSEWNIRLKARLAKFDSFSNLNNISESN
jgi:hypothetical protein